MRPICRPPVISSLLVAITLLLPTGPLLSPPDYHEVPLLSPQSHSLLSPTPQSSHYHVSPLLSPACPLLSPPLATRSASPQCLGRGPMAAETGGDDLPPPLPLPGVGQRPLEVAREGERGEREGGTPAGGTRKQNGRRRLGVSHRKPDTYGTWEMSWG